MDKKLLIDSYNKGQIGKRELGLLRRMTLEDLLRGFKNNPKVALKVLTKKQNKIDLKKLASLVGFGIEPVNIRQSFKDEIIAAEKKLVEDHIIKTEDKDAKERKAENIEAFIAFIEKRLDSPDYEWPVNQKGALYRKGIWAFFIDTPIEEIDYASPILSKDSIIAKILADIDVKIANKGLKTISFASDSALDEMSDTMRSRAISQLRQQLKEAQEKLTEEREARLKIERELNQYKQAKKQMTGQGKLAVKAGSIH
jgi:ribonuclease HII